MYSRPRGRPLPRRPPLARPLAALPGSTGLDAHLTPITILCGKTMESAGLCLHNRLNPAEIQVSPKGTGLPGCLAKPVGGCQPPPGCGLFRSLSPLRGGAGILLMAPKKRGGTSCCGDRAPSFTESPGLRRLKGLWYDGLVTAEGMERVLEDGWYQGKPHRQLCCSGLDSVRKGSWDDTGLSCFNVVL